MAIFAGNISGSSLTGSVSYASLVNVPSGIVSSSAQITTSLPANTVSSSAQVQAFLPDGTVSSSVQYPGWVTASSQIDITATTNYTTFSSSLATVGGVQQVSINALNAATSSYALQTQLQGVASSSNQVKTYLPDGTVSSSAQYPGWVTASSQIDYNSIQNKLSGVYSSSAQTVAAIAGQTIEPAIINATGVISGASINVSGNGTVGGNLTVTGTVFATSQSVQYVSSSTLNVATNRIIVNTDNALRFGGISVVDSGSVGNSGSLYWDSVNDRWIYEDVTGGNYTSAIIVAGPQNTGATGTERGLLSGRVPVASGDDHIDTAAASSSIRVDFPSRLTHVEAGLFITGNLTANGTVTLQGIPSSSAQVQALLPGGTVSSSTQTQANLPGGTVSSSTQYPGWMTSSAQVVWSSVNYNSNIISSSTQFKTLTDPFTGSFTGSQTGTVTSSITNGVGFLGTSSWAVSASWAPGGASVSASYALTASYAQNVPVATFDAYTFDADGVTNSYIVSKSYGTNGLIVSVDGLVYTTPTDYTSSGAIITFVDTPTSASTIYIRGLVNTSNAVGTYSGSFYGDGSGLTTLPISVTADIYQFTGDGVTKNYALARVLDISSLEVSVAGLRYAPNTDYSMSLFTLSFLTAPPSGANIYVRGLINTPTVATGSFSGSFTGTFVGLSSSAVFASQSLTATSASFAATASAATSITFTPSTASFAATASAATSITFTPSTASFASNLGGGSANYIPLWTSATAQSFSNLYQNSGNIGIGTTSPGGILEAVNTTSGNSVRITSSTGSVPAGIVYTTAGVQNWSVGVSGSSFIWNAGNIFAGSTAMLLSSNGNLCIGTTNSALQSGGTGITLYGSSNSEIKFLNSSTGTTATDGTALVVSSLDFNINNREAGAIIVGTSNTERLRIDSSGNVGVNNSVPSASLHVSGTTMVDQIIEKVNITGSAPPATFNIDLTSGSIFFRSASTSANWTTNFRGNTTTTLNSMLYNGQSITATILVYNGATAYSASAYQVDGVSITPRWQGGTSGSANASSLDAHQFTIIKVASASYVMLGSITKYT